MHKLAPLLVYSGEKITGACWKYLANSQGLVHDIEHSLKRFREHVTQYMLRQHDVKITSGIQQIQKFITQTMPDL